MSDRKKLADRIRALLAKTVDNGCTEAEAIAAAETAKRLMDQYQLSLSDLELERDGVSQDDTDKFSGGFDVPGRICVAIAAFCDVKGWCHKRRVTYFGLTSDAEFAKWLTAALEAFCWRQADIYQTDKRRRKLPTNWTDRRSFVQGCAERLNERLLAEAEERKRQQRTDGAGRSLIVVKNQIVEREFEKTGIKLRSSGISEPGAYAGAFHAGMRAGDRVTFGRPINRDEQRLIGK